MEADLDEIDAEIEDPQKWNRLKQQLFSESLGGSDFFVYLCPVHSSPRRWHEKRKEFYDLTTMTKNKLTRNARKEFYGEISKFFY